MWSTQEYSEVDVVPRRTRVRMVQSRSNFDDDGARPVPYLQLVTLVKVSVKL